MSGKTVICHQVKIGGIFTENSPVTNGAKGPAVPVYFMSDFYFPGGQMLNMWYDLQNIWSYHCFWYRKYHFFCTTSFLKVSTYASFYYFYDDVLTGQCLKTITLHVNLNRMMPYCVFYERFLFSWGAKC